MFKCLLLWIVWKYFRSVLLKTQSLRIEIRRPLASRAGSHFSAFRCCRGTQILPSSARSTDALHTFGIIWTICDHLANIPRTRHPRTGAAPFLGQSSGRRSKEASPAGPPQSCRVWCVCLYTVTLYTCMILYDYDRLLYYTAFMFAWTHSCNFESCRFLLKL